MKLFYFFIAFIILQFNSACSVLDKTVQVYDSAKEFVFPSGEKLRWEKVSMGVGENANKNFPIAVDIAMIFEEGLVPRIEKLTANDWFKSKKNILNSFPTGLVIKSWELAPGDSLQVPSTFFGKERIFAVVAFADYFTDGDHRARIDKLEGLILLEFGDESFSAYAVKRN